MHPAVSASPSSGWAYQSRMVDDIRIGGLEKGHDPSKLLRRERLCAFPTTSQFPFSRNGRKGKYSCGIASMKVFGS